MLITRTAYSSMERQSVLSQVQPFSYLTQLNQDTEKKGTAPSTVLRLACSYKQWLHNSSTTRMPPRSIGQHDSTVLDESYHRSPSVLKKSR